MADLTVEIVDLRVRRRRWRQAGAAMHAAVALTVALTAAAAATTGGLLLAGVRFTTADGRIGFVMPSPPGVGQQAAAYGRAAGTILAYGPAVVSVAGDVATDNGVAVAAAELPAAAGGSGRQSVQVPRRSVAWITPGGVLTVGPVGAVHAVVYWFG